MSVPVPVLIRLPGAAPPAVLITPPPSIGPPMIVLPAPAMVRSLMMVWSAPVTFKVMPLAVVHVCGVPTVTGTLIVTLWLAWMPPAVTVSAPLL